MVSSTVIQVNKEDEPSKKDGFSRRAHKAKVSGGNRTLQGAIHAVQRKERRKRRMSETSFETVMWTGSPN